MLILKAPAQAETMAKNSRFLAELTAVSDPESARALWRERKSTYDNGGHIVYAFIAGPQGNVMGCSDDGEPSGTAGRPALAVLKGSGITDVLLTIARWFGGTKLGTGGLVRAYSDAAKAVLANAVTAEAIPMAEFGFAVEYELYERVRRLLDASGFVTGREEFGSDVSLEGSLPEKELPRLQRELEELSRGRIRWLRKS